jgi:tetratricopeptide (TPR) repeat protein
LAYQGKFVAAESSVAASKKAFPGNSTFIFAEIMSDRWAGKLDIARARYDSARKAGDKRSPQTAVLGAIVLAGAQGRYADEKSLERERVVIDSVRGTPYPAALGMADLAWNRGIAGASTDDAVKSLDAAIVALNFKALALADRPYLYFAISYAAAGRVDLAKAYLARFDADVRDTAMRRVQLPNYQTAMATVAAREKRWNEAMDLFRKADRLPDGPLDPNPTYTLTNVLWTWALAGQADSAIVEYERYLKTPMGGRKRVGPDIFVPAAITEALAKMYDAKGNTERASSLYRDFIELWKNADPELQPRVAEARKRLAKLTPVEKAK